MRKISLLTFVNPVLIGDNIILIYNLMDNKESNDIPEMLFGIDFEKRFNSVTWPFFCGSDDSRKWFNILYIVARSFLKIDVTLSPWFLVSGTVARVNLSLSYIFILFVEALADLIRNKRL